MIFKSFRYFSFLLLFVTVVELAQAYPVDCNPNGPVDGIMGIANYCEVPSSMSGGSAKNTENQIYSGFIWELFGDQGLIPQFMIGVRSIQVKENDQIKGADASFRIKYQDKLSMDSLRLAYVGGKRDIMGNLGAGYSFSESSWLVTAAIQGPYTRLSTDWTFSDNKFRYYAELNTLDKPSKVMRPMISGACPSGYELVSVNNGYLTYYAAADGQVNVDPNQIVNDKTCYKPDQVF